MLEVYLQKGRQVVTPGAAALQACFVKSLEFDENYAAAWNNLGVVGGGTVKGQAYDAKDRAGVPDLGACQTLQLPGVNGRPKLIIAR